MLRTGTVDSYSRQRGAPHMQLRGGRRRAARVLTRAPRLRSGDARRYRYSRGEGGLRRKAAVHATLGRRKWPDRSGQADRSICSHRARNRTAVRLGVFSRGAQHFTICCLDAAHRATAPACAQCPIAVRCTKDLAAFSGGARIPAALRRQVGPGPGRHR